MLEYFKTILKKVSFDRSLFEKELKKAIKALVEKELDEFRTWCYSQFSSKYPKILDNNFNAIAI